MNSITTIASSFDSTVIVLATVSFITVSVHYYYKNAFNYWKRRGLKNPKTLPVVGNLKSLLLDERGKLDRTWRKECGKIYGIFMGTSPALVVADPEVLNQICIRNFESFVNHSPIEFGNKLQKLFLISLEGEHWKRVRAFMSPTFTSGKIKRMFRFLDGCADDLVACFDEHLTRGGIVEAKEAYSLFTMDAISTCCYGLKLERAGSTNLKAAASRNDYVRMVMKVFSYEYLRIFVSLTVPKIILRYFDFTTSDMKKFMPMAKTVEQLVEKRREASRATSKKFDDYLQLLLDAKLTDKMDLGEMDLTENHHAGLTEESLLADQQRMVKQVSGNQVKLYDDEIIANAMFLLIVGLETTGTLLTNATYALAFHQEVQQKLYDELAKIVEFDESKKKCSFSYEALTSCRYLDAVISETLRLLSPAISLDRVANEDYFIEKYNLHVPKGMIVILAYHAIMNDPDYWPEPEKFDPERFMPGNKERIKPGAYCPFGIGPRHCIGMRFSLTEAKLALAKIVMNFRIEPAPGTTYPPKMKVGMPNPRVVLHGVQDPRIRIVPRTN